MTTRPLTPLGQQGHHLLRVAGKLADLVPPPERHVPVNGLWNSTWTLKDVNERSFGLWVENCAKAGGWAYYHTHNAKHSVPGFPDYVLVHPLTLIENTKHPALLVGTRHLYGALLIRELKTEGGKLTQPQLVWRAIFTLMGMDYSIWRPSNRDLIMRTLCPEHAI